jgi:hypothetical protein
VHPQFLTRLHLAGRRGDRFESEHVESPSGKICTIKRRTRQFVLAIDHRLIGYMRIYRLP